MKSLYDFIIEPLGERYNNKKQIGNSELILNNKIETWKFINKFAVVVQTPLNIETPIQIGDIVSINRVTNTIVCNWDPSPATAPYPASDDFIMFSKDNKANLSSLLGYYALVKIRNDSLEKAEMFSVGADFVESSK